MNPHEAEVMMRAGVSQGASVLLLGHYVAFKPHRRPWEVGVIPISHITKAKSLRLDWGRPYKLVSGGAEIHSHPGLVPETRTLPRTLSPTLRLPPDTQLAQQHGTQEEAGGQAALGSVHDFCHR